MESRALLDASTENDERPGVHDLSSMSTTTPSSATVETFLTIDADSLLSASPEPRHDLRYKMNNVLSGLPSN